jgi:hypothetical protein
MKFGDTDVNETLDWSAWSWKDFLDFYATSLKNVKESPEEVAKVLGVKVPVQKPKGESV